MDMVLHRIDTGLLPGGSIVRSRQPIDGADVPIATVRFEAYGILRHEGEVRELILGLKYGRNTQLALNLAEILATAIRAEVPATGIDVATWAPTTEERRLSRGFDQAELITRHLGALCGIRVRRLLRRTNAGSQTHSSRTERLERPRFVARPRLAGHVLLIDDVVTTGSTFMAATRALASAGASKVTCIAPSWTPADVAVSSACPPE